MGIILNNGQSIAAEKTSRWIKNPNKSVWRLSGPAGSGKSTIVYYVIDAVGYKTDEVLFVAYTGKATLALTVKGCNAYTIHSQFYEIVEEPKLDENGKQIHMLGKPVTTKKFKKKPYISSKIKLIVIDEGGMISSEMLDDLMSFGIPIWMLGDIDQLPPIFGKSAFDVEPDVIVTEIMRQSLDDPIIYLSVLARNKRYIRPGKYGDKCYVIKKDDMTDDMMRFSDVIICGTNKTRHQINDYMRREVYKIHSDYPVSGDKLICRRNNWNLILKDKYALVNGMCGYSLTDTSYSNYDRSRGTITLDFRPDFLDHGKFRDIEIDVEYLLDTDSNKNSSNKYRFSPGEKFEYGNAITGHLSQGSQYPSVLIYNEYLPNNIYSRWLYTVITRAEEFLILAI